MRAVCCRPESYFLFPPFFFLAALLLILLIGLFKRLFGERLFGERLLACCLLLRLLGRGLFGSFLAGAFFAAFLATAFFAAFLAGAFFAAFLAAFLGGAFLAAFLAAAFLAAFLAGFLAAGAGAASTTTITSSEERSSSSEEVRIPEISPSSSSSSAKSSSTSESHSSGSPRGRRHSLSLSNKSSIRFPPAVRRCTRVSALTRSGRHTPLTEVHCSYSLHTVNTKDKRGMQFSLFFCGLRCGGGFCERLSLCSGFRFGRGLRCRAMRCSGRSDRFMRRRACMRSCRRCCRSLCPGCADGREHRLATNSRRPGSPHSGGDLVPAPQLGQRDAIAVGDSDKSIAPPRGVKPCPLQRRGFRGRRNHQSLQIGDAIARLQLVGLGQLQFR